MLPTKVRTNEDIDELAKSMKEDLCEAKKAGYDGIAIYRLNPGEVVNRSELRFTFEQSGIKFSGCLYEPEIIGTILRAFANTH